MVTEKILVVDDEDNVCRSVEKILSRRGYTVAGALNVEEAVRKVEETAFDVVITDLMMPKTNGMELLEILRDRYPELKVVMITGYASIESAVKATKLGAAYLPKPFTPDELVKATEQALEERRRPKKPTPVRIERQAPPEAGGVIDVDLPFNEREVARSTSPGYVESLTRTDIPVAKKQPLKAYCSTGKRECRRLVLEGHECVGECPLEKKEKARARSAGRVVSPAREIIDADLPFDLSEVERITGPEYVSCLGRSEIPLAALWGRDATAKHSVLVVDDEPIVCHSVRRILAKKQCTVEEAFDVDAALRRMKLNSYDLIILDLKMPKRTGMEVLRSIKEQWPAVPVIMLTGFASIESAIEATRLGAFNFLSKPFTPEELSKVAVEALAA